MTLASPALRSDENETAWRRSLRTGTMLIAAAAAAMTPSAEARPGRRALPSVAIAPRSACPADGLIHAEVSAAITEHVMNAIRIVEKGARARDVARLALPCGFRLDARSGWNLMLTNGAEVRRYAENNAFGFAPAFGFGGETTRSYTLNFSPADVTALHADACLALIRQLQPPMQRCSSFGSTTAFFATTAIGRHTKLAHVVMRDGRLDRDFDVATIDGRVESVFFVPPPDAPGGTITLILADDRGTYRVFLDVPRG